ncbi:WG repeat-containing protein [Ruminococcus sp.]|uniref:WG repeat-containing protein n=1 Tax=Ruminococcus sp. TaxID=41978 RepID=UPI0025DD0249|nr:WG repeat-containing protein [Ruminococcus sp.]
MNKRMRLVVSVLFIVIIVLAAAITRFFSNSEKNSASSSEQPAVERIIDTDHNGNRVFKGGDGLFGIIDSSNRVIVNPEWQDIRFTQSNICIAAKRINGKLQYGCIDYEGNVTVPFVFSSIEPERFPARLLYFAKTADDSFAVYNQDFNPCFREPWKKCKSDGSLLIVGSDNETYTYSVTEKSLIFIKASLNDVIMSNLPYQIEINKRNMLLKLDPQILEAISRDFRKYLEFAYNKDSSSTGLVQSMQIKPLFPNEEGLSLTLKSISNINTKIIPSNDDRLHVVMSFSAGTDVKYTEDGTSKQLHDDYEAKLVFAGTSSLDFHLISGSFINDKPDYPEPEEENKDEDEQEDEA